MNIFGINVSPQIAKLSYLLKLENLYTKSDSAHGIPHVVDVAKNVEIIGMQTDMKPRHIELAQIAALLHDEQRSASELAKSDEEISAQNSYYLLKQLNEADIFQTNENEMKNIYLSILKHPKAPDTWSFSDLDVSVRASLFIADKIAANGPWVGARRAAFVSGERLNNGDLKNFNFDGNPLTPTQAFILESIRRMGWVNPSRLYPSEIGFIINPMYQVQEEFVLGACRFAGLNTTKEIASFLQNTVDPSGQSYFEASGIKASTDLATLAEEVAINCKISDDMLSKVTTDQMESSNEMISYFAERFSQDLDQLVISWSPAKQYALKWKNGMVEYANGTWHQNIKMQILQTKIDNLHFQFKLLAE
jgi:hypothetical protein